VPRQNRITPFGEFEATPARGLLMGNRGILHDRQGRLGTARWRHKTWIACTLSFKNRSRVIFSPDRYTELFFCDEAVSLAAGHRPCAECRREDYRRYAGAWQKAYRLALPPKAGEMDQALHRSRVSADKGQATFAAKVGDLPDGTFVSFPQEPDAAWLVWRGDLHGWSHEGYGKTRPSKPPEDAIVLTPEPTVRVLGAGYVPFVHSTMPSARDGLE
jgi:hypothetical protein